MKIIKTSVMNRLLAMKFLQEFIFIYPLYTIMFGDRGGVSASGIGIILALGFILTITLEIPTGVIADRIPRKYVLVSALFIKTLSMATWLLIPNFTGYCIGIGLHSLANALESGALQAYLYGVLGEDSKMKFAKFWARVSAMVMVSYTVAYVAASIVGPKYPILLIMSIASCLSALAICISLPVDKLSITSISKVKILGPAIRHIVNTVELKKVILSAIVVVGLAEITIEYLPQYYNQIGIETRYVPLLLALGNIIGAVLFWTLHSYDSFLDKNKLYIGAICLASFTASFLFTENVIVLCAGMIVVSRFWRVLQVQTDSNIQHLSNDNTRATVASISSFIAKSLAALIAIMVGMLSADNIIVDPLRFAILFGGLIFLVLSVFIKIKQTHA